MARRSPVDGPIAKNRTHDDCHHGAVARIVFLLDVDNTLLDNDRFNADLDREVRTLLGDERTVRFHAIYEEVRQACGYVDYPETLRRFAREFADEPHYTEVCALVLGHPFAPYVFPGALEAIAALSRQGRTVILSDGDLIFQAAKIGRSGLARAVDGRVLIYEHKEERLDEVRRRFPAERYVVIDDKPRILHEVKEREPDVTTVFVRQGKYARETEGCREPDRVVERVADLARVRF
jgi:FMN phosphatase YigB (HAD superfamily)